MKELMRCPFCGLLQDEPSGVKACQRCGGELVFEEAPAQDHQSSYLKVQMELDQVNAPANQMVDRHLLVTLRTPVEVPEAHLAQTQSGRPPLSFNVILDVSGSMHGDKIAHTRQALRMAARLLHEGDQLAMTVFSDAAKQILPPTPFNSESRKVFESLVGELHPGGSTALYDGLELGLEQAQAMRSENNLTLLLSDGQANVGETDLELIGILAKKAAEKGLIVSTLGVGMGYNEALMTEVATQGKGRFYHVRTPDEIVPVMTGELGEAADVAARDVQIQLQLPRGAGLMPLSAAHTCEIVKGSAVVQIGDIPVDLEVEVPLRLTLLPGKQEDRLSVEGEVTHLTPAGSKLAAPLNRVTVRFVSPNRYQANMGVVQPVAKRVAQQLRAKQVLDYSRAFSRADEQAVQTAEKERSRLREYIQLLDKDIQKEFQQVMDEELQSIRSSSPEAKSAVYDAYQTQRSMRGRKNDQ